MTSWAHRTPELRFGAFRLDPHAQCLRRGDEALRLRAKTFALLQYLAERSGQLVTKEELLSALWPDVAVGDAVLSVSISEVRTALDDNPQSPRFIETVHRRGYRFIAPLDGAGARAVEDAAREARDQLVVGRDAQIQRLLGWFAEARAGARHTVLVTGEPGIGKTTLVDAFLREATAAETVWIARGYCVPHQGPGEAYLPVLDALARLGRERGRDIVADVLAQHAPSWLARLPSLTRGPDRERVARIAPDTSEERMLRELAEALDTLAAEHPLILFLEDLHWSHPAVIDALAWLARRPEPARFLLLATYRPVEVVLRAHPLGPLRRELMRQRRCQHLALDQLPEAAIAEYVAARFGDGLGNTPVHRELARAIYRRTDGHPLFMVTVADHAVREGWLVEANGSWSMTVSAEQIATAVPESLRELIDQELEALPPDDQQLLEAASVAGPEFSSAAVAAGLDAATVPIERRCADLARRNLFLDARGTAEWPDGTVAARYGFRHVLHHQVVHERVPVGRLAELHRRIGEREEVAYGPRAGELAAELARHFEHAREDRRAIGYRLRAAQNALARRDYRETTEHLGQALATLPRLPVTLERSHLELDLHVALGPALMAVKGFAAPEVERVYRRARDLCAEVGDTPHVFAVLYRWWQHHSVRGRVREASKLAEEVYALAERAHTPAMLAAGRLAMGVSSFHMGELATAVEHLERGATLDGGPPEAWAPDPPLACRRSAALAHCFLGYPERARTESEAAVRHARQRDGVTELTAALVVAARVRAHRREAPATRELADAAIALAREYGLAQRLAAATVLRGWSCAVDGDIAKGMAEMRAGVEGYRATGALDDMPYWLSLLADGHRLAGAVDAGLDVVVDALAIVRDGGIFVWEPELHRLRGALVLLRGGESARREAELCFREAIAVARAQGARVVELRATESLTRHAASPRQRAEARRQLIVIRDQFTEGCGTPDIAAARDLLDVPARRDA